MNVNRSILGCWALAASLLFGCSTPHISRQEREAIERMNPRQPYGLYLLRSPHSRLYVEVDAVESCVPSDADLAALRQFFADCCDKPGSIEFIRSDVIPRAVARGVSPEALVRKYLNGPPPSKDPAPAFLYVLCYDARLSVSPHVWETGHPAFRQWVTSTERAANPHVNLMLPTTIFMNMRYAKRDEVADMLRHEAGHVLGVADRTSHAADYHCLDPNCLMYRSFPGIITSFFVGRKAQHPRQLCPNCVERLNQYSKLTPLPGLRFVGPVLVRDEPDYHVLSLVGRTKVIIGELTDTDCSDFVASVRSEKLVRGGSGWRSDFFIKNAGDPVKVAEILNHAQGDPSLPVRKVIAKSWDDLIQAYHDHHQDADAKVLSSLRGTALRPEHIE